MKLYLFLLFNTISCKLLKKLTSNDTVFLQFLPPDEDVTIATSGDFKQFNAVFETPNPKLIKNYQKQSEAKCNNFRKYNYVIVDQNYTDFKNTVTNLLNEKNLNVHGKYLVILPNLAEVVKYFALLWQNEVYNVVVQTHQGYHTWYPYKHCGEITVRPTNLQEGFLNKIPNKLNCWLRINWSKGSIVVKNPHNDTNPGTFVLIANQLSQTMSAPFQYINSTTDFTKMLLKGEMIKFSEKMVQENTTLALGGFTFGLKLPENNDYTTFVSTMDALILLPPRKTYPKWREFLNFSTTAIVLLVATLILNALTSSVYSIFLVRQRSHLKEKINYHIREIQERGLVQKFEQITCMFTEKKELVKGELIKTLNLDDFVGVFVLLLVGCFLSTIVFVIEKAKHF
ncbi:hypothetical protein TcasGA2_TC015625 [Tribolium castaneum]|uniref:Ionotropic glutamate receptor C-terminal domain-containing protein n=1 Tax=Tribolium castaneum TaxID=7070 RepID=D2A603_TRICA|nr:hypothetical protein TcasGA2_TC015625 [Tribolium castaneum]